MVATLYTVIRAVAILFNGTGIVLALMMLYRDRAALLSKNFVEYMRGGITQVFRVATLIGAMVMVAAQIDYFGVFGIYPTGVRLWLKSSVMFTWSSAMLTYVFYATKPCFPFIFQNYTQVVSYLKYGIISMVTIGNTCYPLTLVATSPAGLATPGIIVLIIFVLSITAAVIVYARLLMIVKNHALTGAKEHQTDELLKAVKRWRTFTISYCSALLLVGISLTQNVMKALFRPEEVLPSIAANNFFDGNVIDVSTYREMLLVVGGTVPVYMFSYKAWLRSTVVVDSNSGGGPSGTGGGGTARLPRATSRTPPSSQRSSRNHLASVRTLSGGRGQEPIALQSLSLPAQSVTERTLSRTASVPSAMSDTVPPPPQPVATAATNATTTTTDELRLFMGSRSRSDSNPSIVVTPGKSSPFTYGGRNTERSYSCCSEPARSGASWSAAASKPHNGGGFDSTKRSSKTGNDSSVSASTHSRSRSASSPRVKAAGAFSYMRALHLRARSPPYHHHHHGSATELTRQGFMNDNDTKSVSSTRNRIDPVLASPTVSEQLELGTRRHIWQPTPHATCRGSSKPH